MTSCFGYFFREKHVALATAAQTETSNFDGLAMAGQTGFRSMQETPGGLATAARATSGRSLGSNSIGGGAVLARRKQDVVQSVPKVSSQAASCVSGSPLDQLDLCQSGGHTPSSSGSSPDQFDSCNNGSQEVFVETVSVDFSSGTVSRLQVEAMALLSFVQFESSGVFSILPWNARGIL